MATIYGRDEDERIRFAAFEVDLEGHELTHKGEKVRLQDKPFQILSLLLVEPGKIVTREELRRNLWPADTFVDFEGGLNTAIRKLREALQDEARAPRFVETVQRHGYRFIGPVEKTRPGNSKPEGVSTILAEMAPHQSGKNDKSNEGVREPYVMRIAVLAIAAGIVLLLSLNVADVRTYLFKRSVAGRIRSLAVLPLNNLSGDPSQEYFVDGMTDALITNLSKISALRVISHTSVSHFKGTKKPLHEIATELQVDAVLEGSVEREADRVRITANLVQAFPEKHLWAESYDRDLQSILDLQNEIARAIADQIKITVTPDERRRMEISQIVDFEEHELYLKGAFYNDKWTKEGFNRAIEYFHRALEKDPRDARAYVGLAVAYGGLGIYGESNGYPQQKAASLKALEIDETLGDAHTTLAWAKFTFDWDVAGAEQEFLRAIELNPSDARTHAWYGTFLALRGHVEDSLRQVKRARELDPLSLANTSTATFFAYYYAGDYHKAIQVCREALDLDATFLPAHEWLEEVYEQTGELEKAIEEQQLATALAGEGSQAARDLNLLRKAYAEKGAEGYWVQKLELFRAEAHGNNLINIAKVYTRLGNKGDAFRWLDAAFKDRVPYLIWNLPANPDLDALRSERRYTELLRRLGPRFG